MSTLDINSDMLGETIAFMIVHSFNFVFPLLLPKTFSFSRSPPNLSQKNDNLGLIHRWIIVKFEHHIRNPIKRIVTVGNFKNMSDLREIPFSP